jgi:hypothetical protein
MRNITLSADPRQIELARTRARLNSTTLNELFRAWIADYVSDNKIETDVKRILGEFKHFRAGKMPTREELNERG